MFLSFGKQIAGEYVGLTGARLDGAELLAFGLATHFVHSSVCFGIDESRFEVLK